MRTCDLRFAIMERAGTWNDDVLWKQHVGKELDEWAKSQVVRLPPVSDVERHAFHMPVAGDPVIVSGSRKRRDLNGARGEVITGKLDEAGHVTVRIYDGVGGTKNMKIKASHLVPMRSASTPSLRNSLDDDDVSSVRTCTRRGGSSVASFAPPSSRGLGTVVSCASTRRGNDVEPPRKPGTGLGAGDGDAGRAFASPLPRTPGVRSSWSRAPTSHLEISPL